MNQTQGRSWSDRIKNELLMRQMLRQRAVRTGKFTLASGAESGVLIDARRVTFNGPFLEAVCPCLDESLEGVAFDAVVGVASGAIGLAAAFVCYLYRSKSVSVEGGYVRASGKGHGTDKLLEGLLYPGDRVVVLEDVVTTGGSVARAVATLVEQASVQVVAVRSIVDRSENLGSLTHLAPVSGPGGYSFLFTMASLLEGLDVANPG